MRISGETMEKALINSKIFISTDLETTGFSLDKGAEIIEIGATMINCETRKIIKSFNRLIKPRNGKISKKITELTNITNEMVSESEYIESILVEFNNFISDYPLVFHNASFDWDRFLDPLLRKQGIIKDSHIIDTLPLTKVCLPELKERKLSSVCNYFGYDIKNAHRALADAKATGSLAVKYREMLIKKHYNTITEEAITQDNRKQTLPEFKIKSINCWNKAKIKRIYILSSWGNLFYDLNKENWYVANTKIESTIDLNVVQENFFRSCKLSTIKDIEEYFNLRMSQKVS